MAEKRHGQAKADEAPTFGSVGSIKAALVSVSPPSSKAPAPARRTLSFGHPDAKLIRPPPPAQNTKVLETSFRGGDPQNQRRLEDMTQWLQSSELESEPAFDRPKRPSERSTVPSLSLPQAARLVEESTLELKAVNPVELSSSELESEPALMPIPKPRSEPMLAELARTVGTLQMTSQRARNNTHPEMNWEANGTSFVPESQRPHKQARSKFVTHIGVPLVLSHLAVAAVVALLFLKGKPVPHPPRTARAAVSEKTTLAAAAPAVPTTIPVGACAAAGGSRVLASKAQVGTGLEVGVLDTGFSVGLATSPTEAVGLRLEGSRLRLAETVRVKSAGAVRHVAVDSRDDESDGLDLRIDADDARTIIGAGEAPAFRIVARGASILGLLDETHGATLAHPLWPLPSGKAGRTGEILRAFGRDDGGAVVALRRPATLWLGVADPSLEAEGPLVPLVRKGATIGTPALTQWGGGGAVAWAERGAGERDWSIMVAGFVPDGEGATILGPIENVAHGMSPTVATLPDGDLLVAYATGAAGAHRVVARRLGHDLRPRGEVLPVSPDAVNAGQPVAAVRPDGRAMVAYFAADRGRAASVLATPLDCDPGL